MTRGRGLLLCGGASARFGRDKLLEPMRDRRPMVEVCARTLVASVGRVLAVTRKGRADLRAILEAARCEVIETDRSLEGIGSSLAAGVEASADASGWIVALADMPFIEAATVRAVGAAIEEGAVCAVPVDRASGRRGHPVGFSARLREELLAIRGDEGARAVIARHRDSLRVIAVDDPGILRDVDRPEDLG
jgi:molybdenum cofactor cytidylyltransferase